MIGHRHGITLSVKANHAFPRRYECINPGQDSQAISQINIVVLNRFKLNKSLCIQNNWEKNEHGERKEGKIFHDLYSLGGDKNDDNK
jgi:hypothetical protein